MTSGDFLADRIAGRNVVVAIDGPAGSGKSSVAQAVAERLGFAKLDTGATYRAVALAALGEGVDLGDGAALAAIASDVNLTATGVYYRGERIPEDALRTPEVSAAASRVSAHAELREVLVERQRTAAREAQAAGGAVVEGRDIGTVVLPDAELKVFLSAAPEERARRRALQTGREEELERIRKAMHTRDKRDSEREASPLKPAPGAVVLDTTGLSLEGVVSRIVEFARERQGNL
jgi:CMP/dCMP kinase